MNWPHIPNIGRRSKLLAATAAVLIAALLLLLSRVFGADSPNPEVSDIGRPPTDAPVLARVPEPDQELDDEELDDLEIDTEFGMITVDEFAYTERSGVRTLSALNSDADPEGDDGYVVVALTVHNTSDQAIVFTPSQIQLEAGSSSDTRYPAPLAGSSTIAATVQPGNDLSVQMRFLVPNDREERLRLGFLDDGERTDKVNVRFPG